MKWGLGNTDVGLTVVVTDFDLICWHHCASIVFAGLGVGPSSG